MHVGRYTVVLRRTEWLQLRIYVIYLICAVVFYLIMSVMNKEVVCYIVLSIHTSGNTSALLAIRSALLSESNHDIDKAAVVFQALAGSTSWLLRLLLLFYLWCLSTHFTSTGQGSVNLSCKT